MTVDQIRKLHYKQEGREEGIKEAILDLLSDIGTIDDALIKKIAMQNDVIILKQWNKMAAKSNSIEEFLEKIIHC